MTGLFYVPPEKYTIWDNYHGRERRIVDSKTDQYYDGCGVVYDSGKDTSRPATAGDIAAYERGRIKYINVLLKAEATSRQVGWRKGARKL